MSFILLRRTVSILPIIVLTQYDLTFSNAVTQNRRVIDLNTTNSRFKMKSTGLESTMMFEAKKTMTISIENYRRCRYAPTELLPNDSCIFCDNLCVTNNEFSTPGKSKRA
jgi:hypothetical protein